MSHSMQSPIETKPPFDPYSDPVAYLAATLRAILDGHPQNRIEDLMPWQFQPASSLAA